MRSERICPACGRPWPSQRLIKTADELIARMRDPGEDGRSRDVYEGYKRGVVPTGQYYMTYGYEQVARAAIDEAARRGLIRLRMPGECDCYWILAERA